MLARFSGPVFAAVLARLLDSLAQYICCGRDISSVLGIEQMKLGCEHIGALVHYYYYYHYYYYEY